MINFNAVEKIIFSCYRNAFKDGEFLLPLPDGRASNNMRARAYSAVKGLRKKSRDDRDVEGLLKLIDDVSVHIDEGGLLFRRKDHDPGMIAALSALGDTLVDPAQLVVDEGMARLEKKLMEISADSPKVDAMTAYMNKNRVAPVIDMKPPVMTPEAPTRVPGKTTFVFDPAKYPGWKLGDSMSYAIARDRNLMKWEGLSEEDRLRPEAQNAKP